MSMDERVGALEREQARQGVELKTLTREVCAVGSDIKILLEREATRPTAMTAKTIAATCAGLVSVSVVVWWLIGSSPAVVAIEKRLDKLDDPDTGRMSRLERELLGWVPRVSRAK